MEGIVFNIQRFCVQDGPGVRTTVFLKGCPLRCAWCHNPESHRREPEMLFDPSKCIGCGACAAACPRHSFPDGLHRFDREGCAGCGKCAEQCYAESLELCGRTETVETVLDTVVRDKAFYGETGGMTLSGGEPMYQPDFAIALAKGAKERGVGVCIETCGACDSEKLMEIAQYVDLFLYDVKILDDALHRQYTGASNQKCLENLERISRSGAKIILRCPIIPGVNLTDEHFAGIAALAERLDGVQEIQLEPYHPLGVSKAERLGRTADYAEKQFLERAVVEEYAERARRLTKVSMIVQ